MNVSEILKQKGTAVVTASPQASLTEITGLLDEKRIGAVVMVNLDGTIAGILSERDIVRAIARKGLGVMTEPASTVMTRKVHVCKPSDSLHDVMSLMTDSRIRHLPVTYEGKLMGLISIGDVVKKRIEQTEQEALSLREYIAGT
jgi:CBS domain-containing protein